MVFLERKMYENYLLNPDAITTVMNSIDGFSATPIESSDIEAWLNANRWNSRYIPTRLTEQFAGALEHWIVEVDGAKLLIDLFSYFSESRVQYEKVIYGVALTKWILKHRPEELREVEAILSQFFADDSASTSS